MSIQKLLATPKQKLFVWGLPAFFLVGFLCPEWFVFFGAGAFFAVAFLGIVRAAIVTSAIVVAVATLFASVLTAPCLFVGLVGNWLFPHILRIFI